MMFGGWSAALLAQLYIAFCAFRTSFIAGFLCFIMPGYILFYATRRKNRKIKALIVWGAGLCTCIVGLMLS